MYLEDSLLDTRRVLMSLRKVLCDWQLQFCAAPHPYHREINGVIDGVLAHLQYTTTIPDMAEKLRHALSELSMMTEDSEKNWGMNADDAYDEDRYQQYLEVEKEQ